METPPRGQLDSMSSGWLARTIAQRGRASLRFGALGEAGFAWESVILRATGEGLEE